MRTYFGRFGDGAFTSREVEVAGVDLEDAARVVIRTLDEEDDGLVARRGNGFVEVWTPEDGRSVFFTVARGYLLEPIDRSVVARFTERHGLDEGS